MLIGIVGWTRRAGVALVKRSALLLAAMVACAGIRAEAGIVSLGTAQSFAVLGSAAVTNTGPSAIFGNLGVAPGSSITGFPPGIVTGGSIRVNDAVANQAHADAATAYTALAGLPVTQDLSGQGLGGRTLPPGVYFFSSSVLLNGTLTLDGQGQPDPHFVFQIGSTITTGSASAIVPINGAKADNVFFQVGSSATLGTGTTFVGTIIALASSTTTTGTGASVNGRVIALNGAVTLDSNAITLPQSVPEPGISVGLSMLGLLCCRRRCRPS